jgi:hypothetical protein
MFRALLAYQGAQNCRKRLLNVKQLFYAVLCHLTVGQ